MCMYVCMYVCVCMYVYMYVCMYVYIFILIHSLPFCSRLGHWIKLLNNKKERNINYLRLITLCEPLFFSNISITDIA